MGKLSNLAWAFFDGFTTGSDALGTVLGYCTKDSSFIGYTADRFSMKNVRGLYQQTVERDTLVERTIPEQVVKGIGDVVGLEFSPVFFMIYLLGNLNRHNINSPARVPVDYSIVREGVRLRSD